MRDEEKAQLVAAKHAALDAFDARYDDDMKCAKNTEKLENAEDEANDAFYNLWKALGYPHHCTWWVSRALYRASAGEDERNGKS